MLFPSYSFIQKPEDCCQTCDRSSIVRKIPSQQTCSPFIVYLNKFAQPGGGVLYFFLQSHVTQAKIRMFWGRQEEEAHRLNLLSERRNLALSRGLSNIQRYYCTTNMQMVNNCNSKGLLSVLCAVFADSCVYVGRTPVRRLGQRRRRNACITQKDLSSHFRVASQNSCLREERRLHEA
jgi:hypothetical protein